MRSLSSLESILKVGIRTSPWQQYPKWVNSIFQRKLINLFLKVVGLIQFELDSNGAMQNLETGWVDTSVSVSIKFTWL